MKYEVLPLYSLVMNPRQLSLHLANLCLPYAFLDNVDLLLDFLDLSALPLFLMICKVQLCQVLFHSSLLILLLHVLLTLLQLLVQALGDPREPLAVLSVAYLPRLLIPL